MLGYSVKSLLKETVLKHFKKKKIEAHDAQFYR